MIIAPSILSMHYDKFNEEIQILNENVEWIHFDVMDGHFVPNLTFGPDILKTFRRNSSLFLDVHLMVEDPDYYSKVFVDAGADSIIFHYEVYDDTSECIKLIDKIHSMYVKAGISIKPNTNVEKLMPLLDKVDIVLIMSVEPGFGGQSFMENSLDKIAYLKQYKEDNNLNYIIEVDGGINDKTAYQVLNAGVDSLVAGSYIFNGDIKNNIDKLRNLQ